jgi:NAD dependent epimerase/dehydratase family enzyme
MPVSMREMIEQAGRRSQFPKLTFGIPEFPVRAVLGEMADLTTTDSLVLPENLIREGFVFKNPDIRSALDDLLHKKN